MKMMSLNGCITPPLADNEVDGVKSQYDDETYFLKTYIPLSNLPTPPASSRSNSCDAPLITEVQAPEALQSPLLGPAIHLANMIPSGVSLLDTDVELIHFMLNNAQLPLPTIALAVCILDSLNTRFALNWRRTLPRQPVSAASLQRVDKPPHVDTIRPEVVVLAALILAEKFLDDQEASTVYYIQVWGAADWTCGQINATQQCIMENLGYRLLPLWSEDLISDAMSDMERVGLQAQGQGWTQPKDQSVKLLDIKQQMRNGSIVSWKEN